jgi:transposase
MGHKITYDKNTIDLILELYIEGLSISKIVEKLNLTKTPVKNVIKNKGIMRSGYSNGKKIDFTDEQKKLVKKMYLEEYKTSREISNIFNVSFQYIEKLISKEGYRRNKSEANAMIGVKRYHNINYGEYNKYVENLPIYFKYRKKVYSITKQQSIHLLDNYEKRNNSGIEGAYHLDHKYSIIEGFRTNIKPEIIGNIKNLEFIPWEENIKKRTKCSITIEELNKI